METQPDKSRAVAHYTHQAALAAALSAAKTLQHATLWPWVITLRFTLDGAQMTSTHIVQSTVGNPPDELQFLPAGAEDVFADVFPASRFDDMPLEVRPRYASQYRAFLMWRAAKAIGRPVADMRPWVDFDPIGKHERVESWLRPGRKLGDEPCTAI